MIDLWRPRSPDVPVRRTRGSPQHALIAWFELVFPMQSFSCFDCASFPVRGSLCALRFQQQRSRASRQGGPPPRSVPAPDVPEAWWRRVASHFHDIDRSIRMFPPPHRSRTWICSFCTHLQSLRNYSVLCAPVSDLASLSIQDVSDIRLFPGWGAGPVWLQQRSMRLGQKTETLA